MVIFDLLWLNVLLRVFLAFILLLGLATIPLALREAPRAVWIAHAVLSLALSAVVTVVYHQEGLSEIAPWWKFGLVYLAYCFVPPICAGLAARWAVRTWPERRKTAALIVVPIMIIGTFYGAILIAGVLVPDTVTAGK